MKRDDAKEFTEALGQSWQGNWRQLMWGIQQGIPGAMGLTIEQWVKEVGDNIRLPKEERKEAVKELAEVGLTQREIGAVVGADHRTVGRDLGQMTQAQPDDQEGWHDDGANAPLPTISRPKPSHFKKSQQEVAKIDKAIHSIVDEYSEGLDGAQAAELILNLEAVKDQLQFAIISLGSRFDD
jgi:hypothetical protein